MFSALFGGIKSFYDAMRYYDEAVRCYKSGNLNDAIKYFTKVIELKPDDAEAYYNRGKAKYGLQDYAGAIADYTKAIELKPDNAVAYYNRGDAQGRFQDFAGAIADYTKAIELKPDYTDAYHIRGLTYIALEQYNAAIADAKMAHRLGYGEAEELRKYAESELEKHNKAMAERQQKQPQNPGQAADALLVSKMARVQLGRPAPQASSAQPEILLSHSYIIPYAALTFSLDINNHPIKLGAGGFGAVFRGTWQYVDVAIKKLHIQAMTETALQEFKQETEMMTHLTHPHVIRLYGACVEPDKYCMVMEYMPNGALYHVLHSLNPPTWPVRWQIALDIGKGIFHLHSKNILHRDLKSLNVLLDANYKAKVSDFGLSLVKTETSTTTNQASSQAVGTLPWMAPELFNNERYTKKADIYSYGMILWELASCKNPYANLMMPFLIMVHVQQGKREDIPQNAPPSFANLIARCWAQRAEDRPTIEEVVKELDEKQSEASLQFAA